MIELIRNAPVLIQSIGNNPIALTAFIFLTISVIVYDFFSKASFQQKLKISLVLMAFGFILILTISLIINPLSISLPTEVKPAFSLISLLGLVIGVVGLIESISVVLSESDKNISVFGLMLIVLGLSLVIWQPSANISVSSLMFGVFGRLVASLGVSIATESLLYPDYYSLRYESGSGLGVGVGLVLIIIGFLISVLLG